MNEIDTLSEKELVELEAKIASRRYSIKDECLLVYNSWKEKDGRIETGLTGYKKSYPNLEHNPYKDNYCMGDNIRSLPVKIKELIDLNWMAIDAGRLERMNTGCRDKNGKTIYVGDVLYGKYPTNSGATISEWRGIALMPLYKSVEERVCVIKKLGGSIFTINIEGYGGSAGACGNYQMLEIIGDIFRSPELLKKS